MEFVTEIEKAQQQPALFDAVLASAFAGCVRVATLHAQQNTGSHLGCAVIERGRNVVACAPNNAFAHAEIAALNAVNNDYREKDCLQA